VGYRGERCIPDVENNEAIHRYLLSTPFANLPRALFLLYAPFKVLFQVRQNRVLRCFLGWTGLHM
jgi:hypothetical protein